MLIGPGLLESIYELCLAKEFELKGIRYERQKNIPLIYKGLELDQGYRIDFLVEEEIVLEIKSVDVIHPVFTAQILTYLRLLKRRTGFILNFKVPLLKDGIQRVSL